MHVARRQQPRSPHQCRETCGRRCMMFMVIMYGFWMGTVQGYGFIDASNAMMLSNSTDSSGPGSLCLMMDVTSRACLQRWNALRQTPVESMNDFQQIVLEGKMLFVTSSGLYSWGHAHGKPVDIPGSQHPCRVVRRVIPVDIARNETFIALACTNSTLSQYDRPLAVFTVVIREWDRTISQFQTIQEFTVAGGHRLEAFRIENNTYLMVANYGVELYNSAGASIGVEYNVDSFLYRWDESSRKFIVFQQLPTHGATSLHHFRVGAKDFLAISNMRSSFSKLNVDSVVYLWDGDGFASFQTFPTKSGQDWSSFVVDDRTYLLVANDCDDTSGARNINSVLYAWNPVSNQFEIAQHIPTIAAYGWSSFTAEGDVFAGVANYVGGTLALYRWSQEQHRLIRIQSIPIAGPYDARPFRIASDLFIAVPCDQAAPMLAWAKVQPLSLDAYFLTAYIAMGDADISPCLFNASVAGADPANKYQQALAAGYRFGVVVANGSFLPCATWSTLDYLSIASPPTCPKSAVLNCSMKFHELAAEGVAWQLTARIVSGQELTLGEVNSLSGPLELARAELQVVIVHLLWDGSEVIELLLEGGGWRIGPLQLVLETDLRGSPCNVSEVYDDQLILACPHHPPTWDSATLTVRAGGQQVRLDLNTSLAATPSPTATASSSATRTQTSSSTLSATASATTTAVPSSTATQTTSASATTTAVPSSTTTQTSIPTSTSSMTMPQASSPSCLPAVASAAFPSNSSLPFNYDDPMSVRVGPSERSLSAGLTAAFAVLSIAILALGVTLLAVMSRGKLCLHGSKVPVVSGRRARVSALQSIRVHSRPPGSPANARQQTLNPLYNRAAASGSGEDGDHPRCTAAEESHAACGADMVARRVGEVRAPPLCGNPQRIQHQQLHAMCDDSLRADPIPVLTPGPDW